jgi:pSer/pThr/pTyr-binding forkhead associated (FHA) protein
MRVQLVPLHKGLPIDIARDLTVIGRREDCDLRLDHKGVSKMHCVLVRADGMLLLRDLGSTNGTRVNGRRVRRAALMANDEIRIAGASFRIAVTSAGVPPLPHEHTQELAPGEINSLRERAQAPEEDAEPQAVVSVKINTLPDIYPAKDKSDHKEG